MAPAQGGGDVQASTAPPFLGFLEEQGAGKWRTWFLDDVTKLRPGPPPGPTETAVELATLRDLAAGASPWDLDKARRWDEGPANIPWVDLHIEALGHHPTAPPLAARNLAIVDLAVYDALIATWSAKEFYARAGPGVHDPTLPAFAARANPSYPSEHAAVAGAASRLLAWLYPEDAEYFEDLAADAARSRLVAGVNFPSDVEAGFALGRAVADLVIAARMNDGAEAADAIFPLEQVPAGPDAPYGKCSWKPTPTLYENPWGVAMGNVTPFLLTDRQINDSLAPPPPACDGREYLADHLDVYERSLRDSDALKEWAVWWHDHGWAHPKSHTDPTDSSSVAGMFTPLARDWVMLEHLSTPRSARAFALLHAAEADAFISAWRAKYIWWTDRPINVIQEKFGHTDWFPVIETPSFPGYPSGHSAQGGAAAEVLARLFPTRSYIAQGWGFDNARAREMVGVHPRFDNDEGHAQGVRVAQHFLEWADTDGADDAYVPPAS